MKANKLITLAAVAASAAIPLATNASSITIDSVTQRWPWNNKVDITYTVTDGQNRDGGVYAGIEFTFNMPGVGVRKVNGNTLCASAETGGAGSRQHTVTWIAPTGVRATDCTVTATLFPTNVPSGNDYMIVDLDTGAVTWEGRFAVQADSNARYNTDTYKRTKLALRKIAKTADSAIMPGGPYPSGYMTGRDGYTNANHGNLTKWWIVDKDFYAGVFPVTQAQFVKLMGVNPTLKTPLGDNVAVEHVPWKMTCGRSNSANVKSAIEPNAEGESFLERFNALVRAGAGISGFDLPTSPMWEIAARAGTTTTFYWGDEFDSTKVLVSDIAADVGAHGANPWGLYATIDKVKEWTRDGHANENVGTNPNRTDVFTPVNGTATANARIKGARFCKQSMILVVNDNNPVENVQGSLVASQVVQGKGVTTADWGDGFRVFWIAE